MIGDVTITIERKRIWTFNAAMSRMLTNITNTLIPVWWTCRDNNVPRTRFRHACIHSIATRHSFWIWICECLSVNPLPGRKFLAFSIQNDTCIIRIPPDLTHKPLSEIPYTFTGYFRQRASVLLAPCLCTRQWFLRSWRNEFQVVIRFVVEITVCWRDILNQNENI